MAKAEAAALALANKHEGQLGLRDGKTPPAAGVKVNMKKVKAELNSLHEDINGVNQVAEHTFGGESSQLKANAACRDH